MKKFWLIPAALLIVGAGSFYTVSKVAAATTPLNWHQSLIQKLATTFGKTEVEVQTVFDQSRAEQQATREAEYIARVDAAVKSGEISLAQKQLLLNKHAEMIKTRPEPGFESGQDRNQRRTEMDQRRAELEAWAKQNNLPLDLLSEGFGSRGTRMGANGRGMNR